MLRRHHTRVLLLEASHPANFRTILHAQNLTRHCRRNKFGARHKAHKRAETPCRRSAHKMHPRQGGFKSLLEDWETVNAFDLFQNLRREKRIARDVDAISGSKEHMIDDTLGAIVQLNAHSFPFWARPNDKSSRMDLYVRRPRLYPAGARGANGARSPAILKVAGQPAIKVRPLHQQAYSRRPD